MRVQKSFSKRGRSEYIDCAPVSYNLRPGFEESISLTFFEKDLDGELMLKIKMTPGEALALAERLASAAKSVQ